MNTYMLEYEEQLWNDNNIQFIAGIDEVGRGCLFGDVVAAAVIFPRGLSIEDVNDSKKMNASTRELLFEEIQEKALSIGVGTVDAATIDRINIKQASRLAMKKAVEQLTMIPEYLLIDAEKIESHIPQLAIIKGDQQSHSIAAASIIAKVTRDRMCLQWDLEYPEYSIARHKGYATKLHRERIIEHGASRLHRRSFMKNLFNVQQQLF